MRVIGFASAGRIMTHRNRPCHHATGIAYGARHHSQRESKDRLRRRGCLTQRIGRGAVCAEGNEASAHAGSIRDRMDSRDHARNDMGVGNPVLPGSSAAPGGCATRDGCPQFRFRWNSGLWRLRGPCRRAGAATTNRCRLRKQRPAMQDTLRNGNTTGRRHSYLSSRLQGATSNCCNVS